MKIESLIKNDLPFEEYLNLLKSLVAKNKTTGFEQNEANVKFTHLNIQRMNRIYKTVVINEELKSLVINSQSQQRWLVLTEGWCGDAAQNLPVFAKTAAISPKIDLKIISRDEHPEIMNAFLTGKARSIPKVVFLNHKEEVFAHWGPRPAFAQNMMLSFKKDANETYEDFQIRLQMWYNQDKSQSLQKEVLEILKGIK